MSWHIDCKLLCLNLILFSKITIEDVLVAKGSSTLATWILSTRGLKEYARDGNFYRAYMGRVYWSDGAAEMISMLFQSLLGKPNMGVNKKGELVIMENTKRLKELIDRDKESFRLALGLLINYKPK